MNSALKNFRHFSSQKEGPMNKGFQLVEKMIFAKILDIFHVPCLPRCYKITVKRCRAALYSEQY